MCSRHPRPDGTAGSRGQATDAHGRCDRNPPGPRLLHKQRVTRAGESRPVEVRRVPLEARPVAQPWLPGRDPLNERLDVARGVVVRIDVEHVTPATLNGGVVLDSYAPRAGSVGADVIAKLGYTRSA